MLAEAAHGLGVATIAVDPSPDACAQSATDLVVASFDDLPRISATLIHADHITYEWEGVPQTTVAELGARVAPNQRSLAISQDRMREKECFAALGIATAPWHPVNSEAEIEEALQLVGTPGILKTRSGGYDGKGQRRISKPAELAPAWKELNAPCVYEGLVEFSQEASILVARAASGEMVWYPPVVNVHEEGILRLSIPMEGSLDAAAQQAVAAAQSLLEHLDHVGILTLECFVTEQGWIANEYAPRVHNSGHWTIEGCDISQFEQHVRAVMGMPLQAPSVKGFPAMRNCIGVLPNAPDIAAIPGAVLHAYGKTPRTARKVGHVTVVAATPEEREQLLHQLDDLIRDDG